ncbi:hypothetical protein RHGRI_021517 [Rhododendron griersonianum]|uniref:PUM-HD domain-containing protein n=1 Tax=Rhododendron griersonianum TaxID=479676 RepID=A0AAV6JQR4_9ERIC|nr:hypothetical protein RHGRI_021517 [Rhododendron griersonianum]
MFSRRKSDKEKRVVGNTRADREVEMLWNENMYQRPNGFSFSPSSSSFSNGFSFSEEGLSHSIAPVDQNMYQKSSTHYLNSLAPKSSNGYLLDELGLCENLGRMSIGVGNTDYSKVGRFGLDQDGFGSGFDSHSLGGRSNETFDGVTTDFLDYEGFQSQIPGNCVRYSDDRRETLLGSMNGYNGGDLVGSHLAHNQSSGLYTEPSCYREGLDYQGRGFYNGGLQSQNPPMQMPCLNDELCFPQQSVTDFIGDRNLLNPVNSSQLMYPNVGFSKGNPVCSGSLLNGRNPSSISSMTDSRDAFIIQGKGVKCAVDKRYDGSKGKKKKSSKEIARPNAGEKRKDLRSEIIRSPRSHDSPLLLQPACSPLAQVQGYIYLMAKNQSGCRFLQKIFNEGTSQDVEIIFNEIVNHVVEIAMNSFGNYVMQKLLEVCSEEQRMKIVLTVTEDPRDIIRISLNTHGTRVVQKLIETLKTRQQISRVTLTLEPGFLDLIKDLNGNHVVQRCLQCLGKEDNRFIFDAAAKFCVEIATHQHGCCVMNQCITQSVGKCQEKLVAEIAANGLYLAQHPFGNYVVQYVIELKIPSAAATLISQFEGHYVYLSMQKFGSHVVEKFLKSCEGSRPKIIIELLSVPHFEQLLQDPFANYVIKSALEVSKGTLHAALVEAVRPHTILRASPYCKKIFSRNLLKK